MNIKSGLNEGSLMTKALDRLKRKITTENLWMYIIKILMDEGKPLRAYTVKKKLCEKYGFKIPAITVYTVIYRMTREGLLEKKQVDSDTLYTVTKIGEEAFNDAINILKDTINKLTATA